MSSNFYRAFEDRHRGSRELIQSRLRVYLPFLQALAQIAPDAVITDVGCGRGEWLELLRNEGLRAQGVDLDEGMLRACRERGLDVQRGDAIAFLQGLPDGSQAAVSGFHIAEHLPFETLHLLVAEAMRVLVPGGLLILETPNPENLSVGTSGFYMDPTHERPLPPLLLSFLAEFHGFARVKTLRLQESVSLGSAAAISLLNVLNGVSPDYAIVAQKAFAQGETPDAHRAGRAALDAGFAVAYGVTLDDLAERHEQQWDHRLQQALSTAETARNAALAAQARVAEAHEANEQALERVLAMEQRLLAEMLHAQSQVRAMQQSRSWRLTRPLRWTAEQARALRDQGPRERAARLGRKVARVATRVAVRVIHEHPQVGLVAARCMRAVGLGGLASALKSRFGDSTTSPEVQDLPAPARRVHDALKQAVAAAAATNTKD